MTRQVYLSGIKRWPYVCGGLAKWNLLGSAEESDGGGLAVFCDGGRKEKGSGLELNFSGIEFV